MVFKMFSFQAPKEITTEMKEDLIHLVHERKSLWSNNKNFYRDKIGKTNDWQTIVVALKVKYIDLALLQHCHLNFFRKGTETM